MAFPGFMNIAALTLCIFVLANCNHQVQASSRAFSGKESKISPGNGLCASWVTIHGYKCQELEVTTKDGYILSIQRIPEGRSEVMNNVTKKKEPVIVQHGVAVDGATWFLNSPKQNLPMILADNGFDVWVTNTRGTKYSRKHTSLDPSNKKYWDWSWDELVTDEMPAIFDFVSKQTGGQKINYIGHSLGTLVALVSLSEGKWVNQVKSVALLSPIAYLSKVKTVLGQVGARSLLGEGLTLLGVGEFGLNQVHVLEFFKGVCSQPEVTCDNKLLLSKKYILTEIAGENCCLTSSAFQQFLKVAPQSSSTRNMFNLAQTVRSDVLAKFDFERLGSNMVHYGKLTPPIYNLSNIPKNVPIFISYGGRDALSDVADVKRLLNEHFQNHDTGKLSVQFIDNYAHLDYVMAANANEIVYKNVTSFFQRQW